MSLVIINVLHVQNPHLLVIFVQELELIQLNVSAPHIIMKLPIRHVKNVIILVKNVLLNLYVVIVILTISESKVEIHVFVWMDTLTMESHYVNLVT